MANRKFYGSNGSVDSPELAADHESAEQFDKLRAGRLGVYYREGFRLKFISYDDFDRVFIRINEVNGKLCCGSSVFQYFRLVFVRNGKEFADIISEDEKAMDAALAYIAQHAPKAAIGFDG